MMPFHRSLSARALAAVAVGVIMLAACGSDDSSNDATPTLPLEPATQPSAETSEPTETTADVAEAPDTTAAPGTNLQPSPDKPVVSSLPAQPLTTLGITDLTEGTGPAAAEGDTVIVDYVGVRSADGTEFDNSYDRGAAFPVAPLGTASVIEGWNKGLVGVKAGGRRQLDVPAAMAYADSPPGDPIQAGDDLTFIVDVRAVVPAVDPAAAPQVTVEPTSGATETTFTDLVEGTGAVAESGNTVVVQYIAYSGVDGAQLDTSWVEGGEPLTFTIGGQEYIPGFDPGVEGMQVGGRRQVVIPPEEAFGPDGNEQLGLPAGADLIMVFDLVAAF